MTLRDLLEENLEVDNQDIWENERTPTPVGCFAVRLHSMGLPVREVEGVLAWLGVDRCYQAEVIVRRDRHGPEFLVDAGGYLTAPLSRRY